LEHKTFVIERFVSMRCQQRINRALEFRRTNLKMRKLGIARITDRRDHAVGCQIFPEALWVIKTMSFAEHDRQITS